MCVMSLKNLGGKKKDIIILTRLGDGWKVPETETKGSLLQ